MDVFISYAREDLGIAERVYELLCQAGIQVWFDRESLAPGAKWKASITRAIRSSRYFVALMSSHSSSKRGYVQSEIRLALEVLDEFPETETFVIPVRLDECTPSHPRLSELQWIDLFPNWEAGIHKLVRFLSVGFSLKEKNGESDDRFETLVRISKATTLRKDYPPLLRFQGAYQAGRIGREGRFEHHLRFYPDGSVISASTDGATVDDLETWFSRDWAEEGDSPRGSYILSGGELTFSISWKKGSVDYRGQLLGNGDLLLKVYSRVTGYRGVRQYEFWPWSHDPRMA